MAKRPQQQPFRFVCQLPELIADTSHLAADSFGALMRLRMAYWRNGPIKDDNKVLARIVGMQPAEWAKTRLGLESFFEISNTWTCWTTHRDLEESFKAIAANKARTEAARLAKLNRRMTPETDKPRDRVCDKPRDRPSDIVCDRPSDIVGNSSCDNSFDNVLIGSIRSDANFSPEKPPLKPSLAKAEPVVVDGELGALVAAAESSFARGSDDV
uniref:DUF1376 domain-containing protein n=1 Tax=Dechloromonas aromatica (strain RCB) TaxID=159087 RepID=Q47CK5_DECAR